MRVSGGQHSFTSFSLLVMDADLKEALLRLTAVQDTIEQQLDEIQDALALLTERQLEMEKASRAISADMHKIKKALNL
jgi:hypothetical protein